MTATGIDAKTSDVYDAVYNAVEQAWPYASLVLSTIYDAVFEANRPQCSVEGCYEVAHARHGKIADTRCFFHSGGLERWANR